MDDDQKRDDNQLRTAREKDPYRALGLAANHLMTKPAFARLGFGHWTKTLVGQINRGHFLFILRDQKVVGFVGWALTDEDKAEKWLRDELDLSYKDSLEGDCFLINAWEAENIEVVRFMRATVRELIADKKCLYFKRFYKNGKMKPMRLHVNDFVDGHIQNEKVPTKA